LKQLTGFVKWISSILDKLAGICIFSVMLLIVTNIILRAGFNRPILGTYELVGFLTAIGVGLALGHCALQNGHIAVSFVMEKFSRRIQSTVDIFIYAVSFLFWSASAWYLTRFAQAMKVKGLVSPSAEIPVYPFIYLVALGLLGLCIVLLYKFVVSMHEVLEQFSFAKRSAGMKTLDTAKKVAR